LTGEDDCDRSNRKGGHGNAHTLSGCGNSLERAGNPFFDLFLNFLFLGFFHLFGNLGYRLRLASFFVPATLLLREFGQHREGVLGIGGVLSGTR
jgi:hypothetical protein